MNRLIHLFLALLISPLIQSDYLLVTVSGLDRVQWSPTGEHILYTQRHDQKQGLVRIDANGEHGIQLAAEGQIRAIKWSPDSRQIVYTRNIRASDRSERNLLQIMNADGSDERTIYETDDMSLVSAWSPDGSKLLVWTNRDLFTIAPDGSSYKLIGSDAWIDSQYTWSPDGQRIAYVGREGSAVWVANADGSGAIRVASRYNAGGLTWLPNGQQVSFSYQGDPYEGPKIGVVNANGGGFYDVVDGDDYLAGYSWSPDGTTLVYANYDDVFRVNADGSGEVNLTNSPTGETFPLFSPDGSQIAYIARQPVSGERPEIRLMDPNGANSHAISLNDGGVSDLAWSPNGAYLTFVGSQLPRTSLHVVAASGGAPTVLTGEVGSFAVAPNAQKVAFQMEEYHEFDVYTVNLDGSDLTRLTENEEVTKYEWSPDGARLALYLDHKGLYIVAADAVTLTEASRISTQDIFMPIEWSHDGSLIGFGDNANIFTIDTISGTLTQLTTEGIYLYPRWSPTARTLAFFGTTPTGLALFTYAFDGAGLTKVVDLWGETPGTLLWSPDGSRIAYSSASTEPFLATGAEATPNAPLPPPPIYSRSYVINTDGSGRKFLDDEGQGMRWLPDWRWLQVGTTLVSPDGEERFELGPNGPALNAWSPDSEHFFYLIPEEIGLFTNTGIYVARLNLPSPTTP